MILPTCEEIWRDLRYKTRYFIIDSKRKWYLTSKNPRVIHTRLQGQRLTTLRTCPNDRYLVKHGEYLDVEKKKPEPIKEPDYFESLVDLYNEDFEEEQENSDHSIEVEPPLHSIVDEYISPPPRYSSPVDKSSSFFQKLHQKYPNAEDKEQVYVVIDENHPELSSREQLLLRKMQKRPENDQIWKTVLNDVSLSAARLSTGSTPPSREELGDVSGDFTEKANKDRDFFKRNYDEGKVKFGLGPREVR